MKIALLSDIHANLPALEAVLADIEKQKPDTIYCLGDFIGYNVWPNQVIELIRKNRIASIAGNHDLKLAKLLTKQDNCSTKESSDYAYQLVGNKERNYLLTLPRHLRIEFQLENTSQNMLLVHGSPRSINEYLLEDLPEQYMIDMLQEFNANMLCFGHSHKSYHRILNSGKEANKRLHLINTGSVGKPKDGDPRAGYVIITINPLSNISEKDGIQVEFIRVEYDVEKAAQAVEVSLLPDSFADNLRKGY
ncbi:metallophosphoesterase family protein [Dyadobacter psychrotolerans]|uniref:Metallophosphoesterase n=1 Tax=Dyadobacter psychrotolerans TaxID=2541721 RepID=A0A4R5E0K4_9BACT|nr:metallophosphoesterase family protein [Dyadobacter psychrotolerans]TDE18051.1 metallophosphoesterase [Dyadobacter psychrotolerans]